MENRDWGLGARGRGREAGCWGLVVCLAMTVASGTGLAKQSAANDAAENLTIVAHIYNYAQVEANELARAQDEASRVLGRSGIEAAWVSCSVPGVEHQNAQECRSAPGALVLRILPQAMANNLPFSNDAFAYAAVSSDQRPSIHASVFFHRVEALANQLGFARSTLLGYVMAHEIGHLLLGTNSHSPRGIMRAHWTEKELLSASAGRFGFFPEQAAKLRADIRKRIAVATSAKAAEIVEATIR